MSLLKKITHLFSSKGIYLTIFSVFIIWVIVIWGTLNHFKNYTNFGTEVEVPMLLNNNIKDAPKLLSELGLRYQIVDSIYNPNLVEGTVVYQDPLPTDSTGLKVKSNRLVKLRISKRTRLLEVPYVVSRSQRFAEASLNARGFRTKVTFVPSREDHGSVIEQRIKEKPVSRGQKALVNTQVELLIGERSGGELTLVPDLFGLTIRQAEERMANNTALRLFSICTDCENEADSMVARISNQKPVALDSNLVPSGSTITVFATKNFQPEQ
jgi:beta-lactam-binding protein with PASTA domain